VRDLGAISCALVVAFGAGCSESSDNPSPAVGNTTGASGGGPGTSGGSSGTGGTSGGTSGASGSVGAGGSLGGTTSGGATSAGGSNAGGSVSAGGAGGSLSTGGAGGSVSAGGVGGSAPDAGTSAIPGGGTILFEEKFDDDAFDARGWYDGPSGVIDTSEHASGSASSYRCDFAVSATTCTAGKPARHLITASETVYMGFWLKFSSNWVGSGRAYHPHMFHFINDLDTQYVGPAHTYLTTYTEVVGGRALLALQDSKNVDLGCLIRNNGTIVGCNGDATTYPFTENRSVCSCNGIVGDLDGRDCFPNGNGTWYSSRSWGSDGAFADTPGPNYKADFHYVEVYFEMNSIQGGVGIPDGKIRWVQDGRALISHDAILLRTASHATLSFNQFAMLPYIGDGSPVAQSFWVDDLVVATAKP
jgi:hypothetical protein